MGMKEKRETEKKRKNTEKELVGGNSVPKTFSTILLT